MKIKRLLESIKFEEGKRDYPYQDTLGIWTISYGFTSVNGVKVSHFTPRLTEVQEIETLYDHIFRAINIAMRFVNNFCELSDIRQEVLINMAYQMGTRLLNFNKTRLYINQNKFDQASIEMLDSNWAKVQTPERALRMSEKFK